MGDNRLLSMADNPLVSVITTVLNDIRYLEECVGSVLNQTYPSIEHVFIDGGSSDGTLEMLTSYRSKYPDRIRFISEPDRNAAEAWNKGLKAARGEILGWLGSDDVYEPDAVMTVVEFFQANSDAYFVFGGCNYINEKGKIIGKAHTREFNLKVAINNMCRIPCPSAFYRREVIEKVGLMDTSIHTCDLDYWIRVGKVFQIHRIERPLSNFRIHKDSVSGRKGAGRMYVREGFIINRRHRGSIFSVRVVRYLLYRSVIFAWVLTVMASIYRFVRLRDNK